MRLQMQRVQGGRELLMRSGFLLICFLSNMAYMCVVCTNPGMTLLPTYCLFLCSTAEGRSFTHI